MEIKDIRARKILNSNSAFTAEVIIKTDKGVFRGSSPRGTSNSKYEITDTASGLSDLLKKFNDHLNGLKAKRLGYKEDIFDIERALDEKFIGGPSIALSYALVYALSADLSIQPHMLFGGNGRPLPLCKMLGGGLHSYSLGMDIQELLVTTLNDSIDESLRGTLEVYNNVKALLKEDSTRFFGGVDLEGGFATRLGNYDALKLLKKAIDRAISKTELDIRMGMDIAASTFFKDGKYHYRYPLGDKNEVTREEQTELMERLVDEFDVYIMEDPVDQDFKDGYAKIKKATKAIVVGDDITSTRTDRLELAHDALGGTLIKPNQVGLLYKMEEYSELADRYGITKIVSHRSEETNSPIIADIGVGINAKYLKIGINRGERTEKLNRLMELYSDGV